MPLPSQMERIISTLPTQTRNVIKQAQQRAAQQKQTTAPKPASSPTTSSSSTHPQMSPEVAYIIKNQPAPSIYDSPTPPKSNIPTPTVPQTSKTLISNQPSPPRASVMINPFSQVRTPQQAVDVFASTRPPSPVQPVSTTSRAPQITRIKTPQPTVPKPSQRPQPSKVPPPSPIKTLPKTQKQILADALERTASRLPAPIQEKVQSDIASLREAPKATGKIKAPDIPKAPKKMAPNALLAGMQTVKNKLEEAKEIQKEMGNTDVANQLDKIIKKVDTPMKKLEKTATQTKTYGFNLQGSTAVVNTDLPPPTTVKGILSQFGTSSLTPMKYSNVKDYISPDQQSVFRNSNIYESDGYLFPVTNEVHQLGDDAVQATVSAQRAYTEGKLTEDELNTVASGIVQDSLASMPEDKAKQWMKSYGRFGDKNQYTWQQYKEREPAAELVKNQYTGNMEIELDTNKWARDQWQERGLGENIANAAASAVMGGMFNQEFWIPLLQGDQEKARQSMTDWQYGVYTAGQRAGEQAKEFEAKGIPGLLAYPAAYYKGQTGLIQPTLKSGLVKNVIIPMAGGAAFSGISAAGPTLLSSSSALTRGVGRLATSKLAGAGLMGLAGGYMGADIGYTAAMENQINAIKNSPRGTLFDYGGGTYTREDLLRKIETEGAPVLYKGPLGMAQIGGGRVEDYAPGATAQKGLGYGMQTTSALIGAYNPRTVAQQQRDYELMQQYRQEHPSVTTRFTKKFYDYAETSPRLKQFTESNIGKRFYDWSVGGYRKGRVYTGNKPKVIDESSKLRPNTTKSIRKTHKYVDESGTIDASIDEFGSWRTYRPTGKKEWMSPNQMKTFYKNYSPYKTINTRKSAPLSGKQSDYGPLVNQKYSDVRQIAQQLQSRVSPLKFDVRQGSLEHYIRMDPTKTMFTEQMPISNKYGSFYRIGKSTVGSPQDIITYKPTTPPPGGMQVYPTPKTWYETMIRGGYRSSYPTTRTSGFIMQDNPNVITVTNKGIVGPIGESYLGPTSNVRYINTIPQTPYYQSPNYGSLYHPQFNTGGGYIPKPSLGSRLRLRLFNTEGTQSLMPLQKTTTTTTPSQYVRTYPSDTRPLFSGTGSSSVVIPIASSSFAPSIGAGLLTSSMTRPTTTQQSTYRPQVVSTKPQTKTVKTSKQVQPVSDSQFTPQRRPTTTYRRPETILIEQEKEEVKPYMVQKHDYRPIVDVHRDITPEIIQRTDERTVPGEAERRDVFYIPNRDTLPVRAQEYGQGLVPAQIQDVEYYPVTDVIQTPVASSATVQTPPPAPVPSQSGYAGFPFFIPPMGGTPKGGKVGGGGYQTPGAGRYKERFYRVPNYWGAAPAWLKR